MEMLDPVASGATRDDLLAALADDARTCLVGEDVDGLGNLLLPELSGEIILAIAADCHVLHGRRVAESIVQHLQRQGVLPAKHFKNCVLMLHELLSNAVEYGSLGLASVRKKLSDSPEEIAHYYDLVSTKLQDKSVNQVPILVLCRLVGEELYIKITDQGDGFDVGEVSMDPHATTFGRGVYLVRKFARHMYHEDGGRTIVFTLPSKITVYQNEAPSRLSIKKHGKILLVEDTPQNLDIAYTGFERAGYQQITTAATGSDALAKASAFLPDLILLNIHLPDADGFMIAQQLKADNATRHIPILLIAEGYDREERAKGYRLGAVDFVNKPMDLNELIARAEVHVLNSMMFSHAQEVGQKFKDDLDKARRFQVQMLPQAETLEPLCARHNVILGHDYKASENLGGDYWTVIDVDDRHIGLVLADFTGHGVLAAMNTIRLHALLNELKTKTLLDPEATARALNKKLFKLQDQQGMFATFLYVVIDTFKGTVRYVGCGAPGMFVVKTKDKPAFLSGAGMPLGLLPPQEFEAVTHCYHLAEQETLLAFSDALTENLHHNGKRWLEDGVAAAIVAEQQEITGHNTSQILYNVRERFYQTACQPLSDDLTLVSLTYMP